MDGLTRPAVAMSPERTARTRRALRVVHSLFVRAANYAIHNRNALRALRTNELQNLFKDDVVVPYIGAVGEPSFKRGRLFAFS